MGGVTVCFHVKKKKERVDKHLDSLLYYQQIADQSQIIKRWLLCHVHFAGFSLHTQLCLGTLRQSLTQYFIKIWHIAAKFAISFSKSQGIVVRDYGKPQRATEAAVNREDKWFWL